jgi:hypothetical protein
MNRTVIMLGCCLGLSVPAICQTAALPSVKRERYLLIDRPKQPEPESPLAEAVLKETGIAVDSELGKFLRQNEISKWKSHEDEFVSFRYPDFPGISVAVADKQVPPGTKIYGDPVGTVGRRANRYYTIGADKLTWAVIMLQDGEWIDDGICLCGAVSLRVFVPDGGCLRAYDLLEDGRLKKMQVLGAGRRVQVFEWTHLPMSQENYLKLTESVVLKSAAQKAAADWLELAKKHGSRENLASFLKPGMTGSDVIALLGEPAERQGETLIYKDTEPDLEWLTTSRIALPGGSFRSLPPDWRTSAEIPPKRGTLRWALKLVNGNSQAVLPSDTPPAISPEDLVLLKATCLQQLKSCPGGDWNSWVQIARDLREGGWMEPVLGPLIAARFLDEDVIVNSASILLGDLNPPGTQKLVAKRIRLAFDGAAKEEAMRDQYLHSSPFGDLHNLLCEVKREKQRDAFIREGLAHVHPAVRRDAYSWLDRLPADQATLEVALKGLADGDPYIRRNAAEEFSKRLGKKAQVPALRGFLETEKDQETHDLLGKAIERIEAEP